MDRMQQLLFRMALSKIGLDPDRNMLGHCENAAAHYLTAIDKLGAVPSDIMSMMLGPLLYLCEKCNSDEIRTKAKALFDRLKPHLNKK